MTVPPTEPSAGQVRAVVRRMLLLERDLKDATDKLSLQQQVIGHLLDAIPGGTVVRVSTSDHKQLLEEAISFKGVGWWVSRPRGLSIQIGPPT